MSATPAPPAPPEANDPDRARALKAKIRDRVGDVRRHLVALRVAMAEFGEDFDLDAFRAAYDTEEPVSLNRVKAVERGVDQLYNYIAELTSFGLELAEVRRRGDELNARRDLAALRRIGVLGPERARRLERLRELRRLLVHEYATASAEQVHESARTVALSSGCYQRTRHADYKAARCTAISSTCSARTRAAIRPRCSPDRRRTERLLKLLDFAGSPRCRRRDSNPRHADYDSAALTD